MVDMSKKDIIKKKAEKEFPEFVDMLIGANKQSLENNLLTYAKHREEVELAKSEDEGLASAKETVKELSAPYNDAIKALKLKLAYIHVMLQEILEEDAKEG